MMDRARSPAGKSDFEWAIWQPARDVLAGVNPYQADLTASAIYPPSAFLPGIPFAALPAGVAGAIFHAMLVVAAFLTLQVLDVRDWRCYALWGASILVIDPVAFGNATGIVVLCAAVLWRYRDNPVIAAAALTTGVALKLLIAPLWLWLLFTRRYRAAIYSAVATPVIVLGAWALIGFDGLSTYPHPMRAVSDEWAKDGRFVQALALQLGTGDGAATLAGVAVGVLLVAASWLDRADAISSFAWMSAAAIVLSPLGWVLYAGLVVVPLAVLRPRFSAAWLILPLFWVNAWHGSLPLEGVELTVATLAAAAMLLTASVAHDARTSWPHCEREATRAGVGLHVVAYLGNDLNNGSCSMPFRLAGRRVAGGWPIVRWVLDRPCGSGSGWEGCDAISRGAAR